MKKREWVEIGFAWIFDVFGELSHTRIGVKNGSCGSKKGRRKKRRPKQNGAKKHSEERKGTKLKI